MLWFYTFYHKRLLPIINKGNKWVYILTVYSHPSGLLGQFYQIPDLLPKSSQGAQTAMDSQSVTCRSIRLGSSQNIAPIHLLEHLSVEY